MKIDHCKLKIKLVMKDGINLIFDFDSTFVKVEALDELFGIALASDKNKNEIVEKIKKITELGMEGRITFPESLARRFELLSANKKHVEALTDMLGRNVSESIENNKEFFLKNSQNIYIISGGFCEYICPVVENFGIKRKNVLANKLIFNETGDILGFDKKQLMAQKNGKVREVEKLGLSGETWIIGDGYTDYQVREAGAASKFIAFCENVRREVVVQKADEVANSFEELLLLIKQKVHKGS